MFADWYRNPNNGKYIAMVCIQNKHFYASADTLTRLSHNIKQNLWKAGIPSKWVQLSPNETKAGIDFTWADKKFITKNVLSTNPEFKRTQKSLNAVDKKGLAVDNLEPDDKPKAEPKAESNKDMFITKEHDGVIEVFKVKLVATYTKFVCDTKNAEQDTVIDDLAL